MSGPTDWAAMMRLGLGVLRLSPATFWDMAPAEFEAALEGAGVIRAAGAPTLGRRGLDDLMARFPDGPQG